MGSANLCSSARPSQIAYRVGIAKAKSGRHDRRMGIGASLLLIAAGAILVWAVDYELAEVDIDAVGVILMVVGGIGLLAWLLIWSSFAPFGRRDDIGPP